MNINAVRVDKGMALYQLKKLHDGRHVHQPMVVEHITPANIPKALLWAVEALMVALNTASHLTQPTSLSYSESS